MLGELTRDAVCRGLLHLWQPARGYRFNLDGILLGALGVTRAREPVIDVGAGAGVVGLYVAKVTGLPVILVERVSEVAQLARRNVDENGVHASVVAADFRALPFLDRSVQLVLCNPPYLAPGQGRSSPNVHKQLSRESLHGGAREVLVEAARVLRDDGEVALVTPGVVAAPAGLHRVMRMELVRSEGGPLERVLAVYAREPNVEAVTTRALHGADGRFAPWLDEILEGHVTRLE